MKNTFTLLFTKSLPRLLPAFAFLAMFVLQGCGAYDRAAVWYKYRNDYHLPKQQPTRHTAPAPKAIAQAKAKPEAPATATAAEIAPELAVTNTPPEASKPMSRKDIRRALRHARTEARQMARAPQAPAAEEAYADAGGTEGAGPNRTRLDDRPVWERVLAQPEAAQRPMARSLDWVSVVGFILSLLWFLGTAGIAFAIAGFIVSLIGLTRAGPGKAHSGRGFAIAGLIMGAVGVLLWLLYIG